ncbi:TraB/GumN family protein [Vibrio genomosp. F10 str. 9ZC157]|uniref:TraB/GumN family protein n=1 Tax=Vibrio genomosp. F10 TaxID=723171 RepID=UPI00036A1C2B|nr:TraB/GumN family protein [Vibrio genomosp. F10]OEE93127.1 hypothetical protein A1QM_10515 [Vibrio genomosp. F10 str. 9ZC157]
MRILLFGLSLLLFSSVASSEPLYWSAKKGPYDLMILGSIHVGSEKMYPLPSSITEFLRTSDGLILETDTRKTSDIVYPIATHTAETVLSEPQQKQLSLIAKELNLASETLLSMSPWTAALAIQMGNLNQMGLKTALGVDHVLLYDAIFQDIDILGLESLQFQIDLLATLPNDGKELLVAALDEYQSAQQDVNCLVESWALGDADNMAQFAEASQLSEELERRMMTDRNLDWAEKLDSGKIPGEKSVALKGGRYLVVVGTLHLLGKNNLIEALKERGFEIEKLSKTQKAKCEFL